MLDIHRRMIGASPAEGRMIETRRGRRVHVIEAGEGAPVVFLHGSGTSSLSALSLLEHHAGVRIIALDRPGYGLSDPVDVPRERFREAAVEFVDETVDELGLESFAVAGGSMGGTWALWYALARPERVRRLALLGSAPLLPGTRAPAPLRVMAAPVVGDLLPRLVKPSAKMVVRMMSSMGEGDTIVRHPDLIEAIVAAGRDPIASATDLAELRAILTPLRFRRALRVQPSELQHLTVPTLLIWGDHDPVGTVEVAQTVASLIPHAQLDMVAAGHAVWLGDPKRISGLLSAFVLSSGER
ncbi:MAG: alpha/beta hydrolase [Actinomycetota bacterium]|nr:alpha/beta hydrolase [Actinomycetota bacterium]